MQNVLEYFFHFIRTLTISGLENCDHLVRIGFIVPNVGQINIYIVKFLESH